MGDSLSPKQLAHRKGVKVKTVGDWRQKGTGPVYSKVGGRIEYALSDVEEWERRNRFQSTKERARA
jgi:predicted site-specific integrase-resolvase